MWRVALQGDFEVFVASTVVDASRLLEGSALGPAGGGPIFRLALLDTDDPTQVSGSN